MERKPGDKFGPYQLVSAIGKGGMGEVWKARDTRLQRNVAIKFCGNEFSDRFLREAQAIAALNHSNICTLHDIGPDYLVMEYIEGTPPRGPLAPAEAVQLALGIAAALEAAHSKGIIHRDLKPANILVTQSGSQSGVKLLDFGLALINDNYGVDIGNAPTALTLAGAVMGTAAYMSPEQAHAGPVDARSDIFSFGLVLYEMLSGRRAFPGESDLATIAAILYKEPEPIEAPPALQSILTRCLRKSPADRFQSITQVKEALLAAALPAANSGFSSPGAFSMAQTALPARDSYVERAPSIAVLPFANVGGDKENEYFSDGLAEEILNCLAQIPGLKVIARTSSFAFRGKEEDITRIAETLRVRTLLEGSVRRAGNRVRVTAQLIDAADGSHLWSQRYDRELADVFAVQDDIAQAIASALRVRFSGVPAALEQYKPSLPAYEALLKARHYSLSGRLESVQRAREWYERAIALDPKFALAQCAYGNYFLSMTLLGALPAGEALPMVRSQAQKALELDPSLPEAHAMLGVVAAALEHDWKEAERRFSLATARDPVPINVRFPYALGYLLQVGRPDEALRQLELGLREDPLNLTLRLNRAGCLAAAGREEEAAAAYREFLDLYPDNVGALGALAAHHASRGELDQALVLCEKAYALAPLFPHWIGLLAGLLKRTGETSRAEELHAKLQPGDAFGSPRGLAVYHWALREFDAEAAWLGKAIEQRDLYGSTYLRYWYGRELRSSPRWAELMRMLNLPES
jgi:serine/threonine protein kinase/Tfp pilus assembly protein PilF